MFWCSLLETPLAVFCGKQHFVTLLSSRTLCIALGLIWNVWLVSCSAVLTAASKGLEISQLASLKERPWEKKYIYHWWFVNVFLCQCKNIRYPSTVTQFIDGGRAQSRLQEAIKRASYTVSEGNTDAKASKRSFTAQVLKWNRIKNTWNTIEGCAQIKAVGLRLLSISSITQLTAPSSGCITFGQCTGKVQFVFFVFQHAQLLTQSSKSLPDIPVLGQVTVQSCRAWIHFRLPHAVRKDRKRSASISKPAMLLHQQ